MNIINDILDFSKIESNQLIINNAPQNVQAEIQHSITLYEERIKQKSQNIKVHGLYQLPPCLIFDALRFHQIMNNILANAIKFSPENTLIEVFADYDENTQKLNIKIKDQGIGISKEKQNEIFKPFIQADGSSTRQYDGTGLGLSISQRLVELMGGHIGVKSQYGFGSEFYFSIYSPLAEDSKFKKSNSNQKLKTFHGHVLVVEDNLVNQKLICALLDKFGLSYNLANDGLEAIKAFENKEFDLILMDQNMPNMSGIEACQHIRETEKNLKLKHTPIIALTANAMEGDRELFLNSGMDEYLTKPLKVEVLQTIFNQFLAN